MSAMARLALASDLGDHLPAAADPVFSWRMHRRARRNRQFSSSRPSRLLEHWAEQSPPPEVQLERLQRQLCPCPGSVSLPWLCAPALALPSCQACAVCCLLLIPSLALVGHYPAVLRHSPRVFCFSVQCSLPFILLFPRQGGKAGDRWGGRKRSKVMLSSRSEKSLPCPDPRQL